MTGVKVGLTRATTYTVAEFVEIDIASIPEEQAPVAVEWDGIRQAASIGSDHVREAIPLAPSAGKAHTRLFADRHYCPALEQVGDRSLGEFVTPDILAERRGFGISQDIFGFRFLDPPFPPVSAEALRKHCIVAEGGDLNSHFSRIESSKRVGALQRLTRAAEDCMFVGDRLYRACEAPAIVMADTRVNVLDEDGEHMETTTTAKLLFITHDREHTARRLVRDNGMTGRGTFFDIEHWKKAATSAAKANRGAGYYQNAIDWHNKNAAPLLSVDVKDPAYKKTVAIHEAARNFVNLIETRPLKEFEPETLAAYAVLAIAVRGMRQDGGLDILEEAAISFSEAASRGGASDEARSRAIQPLIDLLADRPVEAGFQIARRPALGT